MQREEQQEETLQTPGVMDKYKDAGKITSKVLNEVIKKTVDGANVLDLCKMGDEMLLKELSQVHNKKRIEKGIAFPTCVSLNEQCGNNTVVENTQVLKQGDVVKVDLGVHIDGYVGQSCQTVVVGGVATDRKADLIRAGWECLQGAIRLLKPGNSNNQVTELISKISEEYNLNPVEGVLSHEIKKHLIDGNRVILNKETFDQKVDDFEFNINEVYILDVMLSTGEGKPKNSDQRTTLFKRALDKVYNLRGKSARVFFTELNEKYPSMFFSLNGFSDEITAKMGIKECMEHDMIIPYPVMVEKQGELVCNFKATVMIGSSATSVLTEQTMDLESLKTQNQIKDKQVLDLLALSMDKDEQKKQRKAAKKAVKS